MSSSFRNYLAQAPDDSGGYVYEKPVAKVAAPPGVTTWTVHGPAAAATGVVTATVVELVTDKLVPATPLNRTAVAPVKKVPVTVTAVAVPCGALVGATEVMVGVGTAGLSIPLSIRTAVPKLLPTPNQ
jgi:hypothetical protein